MSSTTENGGQAATGAQYGGPLEFTVTRDDDLARSLTVFYTRGGTATAGTATTGDYDATSLRSITIPAGQKSAQFQINPNPGDGLENSETVVLRLAPSPSSFGVGVGSAERYRLGMESEQTATGTIYNSDGYSSLGTNLASSSTVSSPTNSISMTFTDLPAGVSGAGWRVSSPDTVIYNFDTTGANATVGDTVLLEYWVRMSPDSKGIIPSSPSSGFLSTWAGSWLDVHNIALSIQYQEFGYQWTCIQVPAVIFDKPTTSWSFVCFSSTQMMDIAGVKVTNFGHNVTVDQLPLTTANYGGRDADADWRQTAQDDIAANRMGNQTILVEDSSGNAVGGANVTYTLVTPDVTFGTPYAADLSATDPATVRTQAVNDYLFDHFQSYFDATGVPTEDWANAVGASTTVGPLNYEWEFYMESPWIPQEFDLLYRTQGPTAAGNVFHDLEVNFMKDLVQYLYDHGYSAADTWMVTNEIKSHIASFWSFMAVNGRTVEQAEADLFKAASDQFLANSRQDIAILYNDYTCFTYYNSALDIDWSEKAIVQGMLSAGAPIDVYGLQSHFDSDGMSPIGWDMQNFLDGYQDMANLKDENGDPVSLTAAVTEFDIDSKYIDQQTQADFTRDFLTLCYSQPNMTSIDFWNEMVTGQWRVRRGLRIYQPRLDAQDWRPDDSGPVDPRVADQWQWNHLEPELGRQQYPRRLQPARHQWRLRRCGYLRRRHHPFAGRCEQWRQQPGCGQMRDSGLEQPGDLGYRERFQPRHDDHAGDVVHNR